MYIFSLIVLIALIISLGLFLYTVIRLIWYMFRIPQREKKIKPKIAWRIYLVIRNVLFQGKLFKEKSGGIMHAFMFWGFLAFAFYSSDLLITALDPTFVFPIKGPLEYAIFFTVDIFALIVAVDVLYAVYRRWIKKIKRYQGYSGFEAAFILFLIETLMVTYLILSGLRIDGYTKGIPGSIMEGLPPYVTPISLLVSKIIPKMAETTATNLYWIIYSIHIGVFLIFLAYIPNSKHLHLVAAPFNVLLADDKPRGAVEPIDFDKQTRFGATDLRDFSWKDYLDFYSCTECGRCTSNCPANLTGKTLSPRDIIWDIRKVVLSEGEKYRTSENRQEFVFSEIPGNVIKEDDLWACTTCSACVEACPVMIDHVDKIIDMRRSLVLNKGSAPKQVLDMYRNMESYGSPWANDPSTRAAWAEGLNVPDLSKNPDQKFEYLFWVGCSASYDPRNQEIAKAFVKIMNSAGVSYAILGSEETCSGDPARRSGNEYLAQMLTNNNIETFKKHQVRKIVTICPHCFNTFKNDYKGIELEVIHHTELIDQLIKDGKIKLQDKNKVEKFTYHDSCYLARYNRVIDAPRDIIFNLTDNYQEMEMNKTKGLCCGAGGARMWMEENVGTKISHARIEQADKINASTVVTACPYCMTMLDDARKVTNREEKIKVKDIAELVAENIKN